MTAQLIDGKQLSKKLRADVARRASLLAIRGRRPVLAVILVGNDHASQIYVRNKEKACKDNGLFSILERYNADFDEVSLLARIDDLNHDPKISGILVQLPLPEHIDTNKVLRAISPKKDVDGFHVINAGLLMTGQPLFRPCTPYGIMKILESINCPIVSAHAVIVGSSNIVGKPQAMMLLQAGATVTMCNSKTHDLRIHTRMADILVVAVGKRNIITADMIKPGATVIDVGINYDSNNILCGDVDFINVKEIAGYITPVPGGVGPMTVTMLLVNTIEATERNLL